MVASFKLHGVFQSMLYTLYPIYQYIECVILTFDDCLSQDGVGIQSLIQQFVVP